MVRRVAFLTALVGLALSLTGCALNLIGGFDRRASWREAEERACLARRDIVATNAITQVREIDGRGACGIDYPLKVSAFDGGSIAVGPSAMLGCPITEAVEAWLREVGPAGGDRLVRLARGRDQGDLQLFLPQPQQCARRPALRACLRQRPRCRWFRARQRSRRERQDRLARRRRRAGFPARDGGDRLPALQDFPRPRRALSRRSFPRRSRPSRPERHVALLQAYTAGDPARPPALWRLARGELPWYSRRTPRRPARGRHQQRSRRSLWRQPRQSR